MKNLLNKNTHVWILLIGIALLFFAQPFKVSRIMSLGTNAITIATVFALYVSFFIRGIRKPSNGSYNEDLLLVFLALFAVCAFIYAGQYSYARFVPLVCFLEMPILVNSVNYSTRKLRNAIYLLFYLFSLYCIFLFRSPQAYRYSGEYGYTDIEALTLGLPNPNQTGMYLMIVFFVLCIAIFEQKNKLFRVLLAISAVIMAYMVYYTQSRAALVTTALFAMFLVPQIRARFSRILVKIAPISTIVIAIILIVYQDSLSTIQFMGEAVDTGRAEIFSKALDSLDASTLMFGNYRMYASQNLHNIFISVFVEYGIIAACLFCGFMWLVNKNRSTVLDGGNTSAALALVGFAVMMIFSGAEAAFYIGGSIYAGFVFLLYYLSLPLDAQEV